MTPGGLSKELKAFMGKPLVLESLLNSEMRGEFVDLITAAVDKFANQDGTGYEDIARTIKEQLDRQYGATWHCAIGESFSFSVTSQYNTAPKTYSLWRYSVLLWSFQERLLFYPGVPKGLETPSSNPKGLRHPGERNIPYSDVYFQTEDGLTLHGWLIKQNDALNAPTLLYFHGNAGNIGFRLPNIEKIFKLVKANLLVVSYRGYGFSEGSPTEDGVFLDAESALDFLHDCKGIDNEKIFAFGRSIGGAVAIELAVRRGSQLRGVIVENTFTSLIDMLFIVFPFLKPFRILVKLVQRLHMTNDEKVTKLKVPFLFLSGRQDQLVPPAHMDSLYQTCGAKIKVMAYVMNGDHNNTWEVGGDLYYQKLRNFVDNVLQQKDYGESCSSIASTADSQADTCAARTRIKPTISNR